MTTRRRTVLVTGAGRGIGRGLVDGYLRQDWHVIATVRGEEQVEALADVGAQVARLEVSDERSVEALGHALAETPIDVLVNNAGTSGPGRQSSLDMDFDGFAQTLSVNVLGPLRVTQALLPQLVAAAPARVVNLSSRMGSLSYAKSDSVAYRSSKAALNKVTQCLATDLAARGVAVAAVHPGWVRTEMGGEEADIDVDTSVAGLMAVVEGLSVATTGRFLDYRGAELDW